MKNLLLKVLLLTLGISTPVFAQSRDDRAAEASRTVQELPELVNAKNHRALGFDTVEEARSGKLGEPIPVFMIRLDSLKSYRGEEPGRLLMDTQRFVYPVQVAGEVRTAVEVRQVDGRWETARIGAAQKIRALDKNRRAVERSTGALPTDFFEVRIPALNMIFLGHHDAEGLMLTPLVDDASLQLQAGRPELASKVLASLVPAALATPDNMP
ncbi:MAG: hypothetical protein JXB05_36225 [Myxococcaceae bacterium]|nr:hypothetical protein [Myxococcaceae bacterium]